MYICLSVQQVVNDGDNTSDESIESEWDDDDEDVYDDDDDDDEEEEDSENGWLFLAAKLTNLYYR
jgi:hypothetical protein